jgi:hypothetical protein
MQPDLSLLAALREFIAANSPQTCTVAHAQHVTIALAASLTGLSQKAIRRKIEEGKWVEGREYHRRDGGIFVDMKGFAAWVERG